MSDAIRRAALGRRALLQGAGAVAVLGMMPARAVVAAADAAVDVPAIMHNAATQSRAMEYVTQLADGIGPRLTGSPNMARAYDWALARMGQLGLDDVRLEAVPLDIMGWQQVAVSARMVAPDHMPIIAQAGAWSMGTQGPVVGDVVAVTLASDADYDQWRGRLADKIVLLGPLRDVPANTQPLTQRYTDEEILSGSPNAPVRAYYANREQRRPQQALAVERATRLQAFLEAEGVAAVVLPSREGAHGGGSGTLSIDDSPFAPHGWRSDTRPGFPFIYAAIEQFGRVWRLGRAGASVQLEINVTVDETEDLQPVWNVVGDFVGSDGVGAGVVVVGAHLDSWHSGTGALDNASGVAAVLEAIRILKAVGYRPKQTIRVVLFGAEEQGLHGAREYVRRHVGARPHTLMLNMDGGAGRVRAVYSGGDSVLAAQFTQWIAPLHGQGVLSVYDEPFWPADQSAFSDAGVPGIMFLQDPLDYFTRARHSNMDTIERVPHSDMTQQSMVVSIMLAHAAYCTSCNP